MVEPYGHAETATFKPSRPRSYTPHYNEVVKTDADDPKHKPLDGNQPPDARKSWYTPAAQAYNRARPDYPDELIDQAIKHAELRADAQLLEVGCGPGTATLSFARRSFAITGIEPNPALCLIARGNL